MERTVILSHARLRTWAFFSPTISRSVADSSSVDLLFIAAPLAALLQVLQSLDMLRRASKLNMSELESSECIGALHTLYTMTLTPIGTYGHRDVLQARA